MKDFEQLSAQLERYHGVFYTIHHLGGFEFSDKIDTACVEFDLIDKSRPVFLFNRKFWESLNETERCFVICHECLHILLNHGERLLTSFKTKYEKIGNIAADIEVNELLFKRFGFNMSELPVLNKIFCLVDTVFKDKNISTDEPLEFYYNLLKKEHSSDFKTLDIHSFKNADELNELVEKIKELMPGEEVEALSETCKQAGNNAIGKLLGTFKKSAVKKKKWESIIVEWSRFKHKERNLTQWNRVNRRFAGLKNDLIMPTDIDIDDKKHDKLDVLFFLDTSGSCSHLGKRFFTAASSLDPSKFNIELFCFDTSVYETSLDSGKLYGFGGTTFSCISNYLKKRKSRTSHNSTIFVITDGCGDTPDIEIKDRKNWFWFLSENYTSCIPKGCNIFNLKDYE